MGRAIHVPRPVSGETLDELSGHWSLQIFPEKKAPRDWSIRVFPLKFIRATALSCEQGKTNRDEPLFLVDVLIFFIFSARGGERGVRGAGGGGGAIFIENPRRGGVSPGGGWGRGARRVLLRIGEFGGGGGGG